MRIIPDGVTLWYPNLDGHNEKCTIEITDGEWDEIINGWITDNQISIKTEGNRNFIVDSKPFPQYLRDLISLAGEGK
jgi:hypothetical protein